MKNDLILFYTGHVSTRLIIDSENILMLCYVEGSRELQNEIAQLKAQLRRGKRKKRVQEEVPAHGRGEDIILLQSE